MLCMHDTTRHFSLILRSFFLLWNYLFYYANTEKKIKLNIKVYKLMVNLWSVCGIASSANQGKTVLKVPLLPGLLPMINSITLFPMSPGSYLLAIAVQHQNLVVINNIYSVLISVSQKSTGNLVVAQGFIRLQSNYWSGSTYQKADDVSVGSSVVAIDRTQNIHL